jgi:uncharacterized membrane protein
MPDLQIPSRPGIALHAIVTILCLVMAPLAIAEMAKIPPLHVISFIGAILVFQPFAASIGVVLNIPPWAIFTTMVSVGTGAVTGILALCDLFAQRWHGLDRMIKKVHERAQQSPGLQRYGMLMFIPFIWVPGLGLYGCTLIAWLFEWRRPEHIAVLLAGWLIAIAIVLTASMGVFLALSL